MPGETVTVPVRISGNPGINAFTFGFDYDESKLSLLDVTVSSNLGGQFVYKKKAVWLNPKDVTYNGEILYLKFYVKKTDTKEETKVRVTYSPGDISNYDEKNVNFKLTQGFVLIGIDQQTMDRILVIFQRILYLLKMNSAFT